MSTQALQFTLGFVLALHYTSIKLSSTLHLNNSKQTGLGKIKTKAGAVSQIMCPNLFRMCKSWERKWK